MFDTTKNSNSFNYRQPNAYLNNVNKDIISNKGKNCYNDTYSTNSTLNQNNFVNEKDFNSWGYSAIKTLKTVNTLEKKQSYPNNFENSMDVPEPIYYKEIFKSNK